MDIDGRAGDGGSKVVGTKYPRSHDVFLRILSLLLSLVAMVVMVVDKQNTTVLLGVIDGAPPLQVPVSAKWHYLSSNVYFLVSNTIACAYAIGSLVWSLTFRTHKHQDSIGHLVMIVLDVVVVGLLFSANGAVAGVGVIAQYGNSHTTWTKVCNVFGRFCHVMAVALAASLLSSLVFLFMVIMALVNLHSRIGSSKV